MRALRMSSTAAIALLLMSTSACDQAPTAEKAIPEGEDAFSCGSLIMAATYVEGDEYKAEVEAIKAKSLADITKFGTLYASAKGIDGTQAFNEIKIKAFRMVGRVPSPDDLVPTADLVRRAKACAAAA